MDNVELNKEFISIATSFILIKMEKLKNIWKMVPRASLYALNNKDNEIYEILIGQKIENGVKFNYC